VRNIGFTETVLAYPIVFILTCIIITVKVLIAIYLGNKIMVQRRQQGVVAKDFTFSIFILMICLMVARILYTIFDFGLTDLNPDNYYTRPAVQVWQIASLISQLGIAYVAWIVDKKVLQNKFKGFFAILIAVIAIIWGFYPIDSKAEFDFISALGIVGGLGAIFIPVIFFWLGAKTPGLRKTAWSIAFGITMFALAAVLINEALLAQLRTALSVDLQTAQNIVYLLFTGFKVCGLVLLTYGGRQFQI
jgi:hypothetical protein